MTGILSIPVIAGSATPTTVPDALVITMPPTQVNRVLCEPAPEPLMPEPIAEVPMQK